MEKKIIELSANYEYKDEAIHIKINYSLLKHKIMKYLFFLILLFSSVLEGKGQEQYTVSGLVKDGQSGEGKLRAGGRWGALTMISAALCIVTLFGAIDPKTAAAPSPEEIQR